MIKLLACLTVLLAINSSPALAASKHCANIEPGLERQACEDGKAGSVQVSVNGTVVPSRFAVTGRKVLITLDQTAELSHDQALKITFR